MHRRVLAAAGAVATTTATCFRSSQCSVPASSDGGDDEIPKGWKDAFSHDGHKVGTNSVSLSTASCKLTRGIYQFYYHETTGETSWTHPNTMKFNKTWDGRTPGKKGVTHQILLVRHGQYEEKGKDDSERKLTPLGRKQAEATGKRINELLAAGVLSPIKVTPITPIPFCLLAL